MVVDPQDGARRVGRPEEAAQGGHERAEGVGGAAGAGGGGLGQKDGGIGGGEEWPCFPGTGARQTHQDRRFCGNVGFQFL